MTTTEPATDPHPLDQPVEGALRGGHRLRPLHGLRRLCHRLPPRRDRVQPRVRVATSRSTSRTSSARPTAATARRAAPAAPGPAPASGPGRRTPTSTSSPRTVRTTRCRGSTRTSCSPGPPTTWSTRWARTAAWSRPCSSGRMDKGYIDGALTSFLEGDGSTWKAIPGVAATKEEVLASAGSRYTYSANPLALTEAKERGLTKLALVGMGCQSSVPPVMWHRKVGKVGQAVHPEHRPDVLQDLRRRHLRGALRGQVRPEEGRHQEGQHQGRLPDLAATTAATTRSTSRSATPGPARAARRCPDFAAEHADISTGGIGKYNDWTLTVVRTDLGPGDHQADAGRRRHHQPAGRRATPTPSS